MDTVTKGTIFRFSACFDEEAFEYFGCQLRYFVFLVGPGGAHTAMSYDVDECLKQCTADFCELAIIMTTLRHYSTIIFGDDTSLSAAHLPGEGSVLGCLWRRHATAQMRDSIRILAAASTALPAETGNAPKQEELHEHVHRVLMKARWATLLRCCDLLHAEDQLAMATGQKLASDLVNYRLRRRTASALHLRVCCWMGDQLAQNHSAYIYIATWIMVKELT